MSRLLFQPRMIGLLFGCLLMALPISTATAQNATFSDDFSTRPIYVTVRVFQMKANRDSYPDLNDQVFKMSTASLSDHTQWMNAFKKSYPGFEIDLLRTEVKKVFRTSKPATVSLVKQQDGRDIEVQMFGAQSIGDGVIPGTTLVPEIGLHFGNDMVNKPVAFSVQPLEVESGKTYFYAVKTLKLRSSDYVKFVRPNTPPEYFDGNDLFLLFTFSVDLDKTTTPARYYDERQSVEFQTQATKKTVPEVPAKWREAGLGGNVRVRVEISPEGQVTNANAYYSGFPEMNQQVIEATRQWEFPKSLFESDKAPITCFLMLSFPAQPIPPKANPAKQ
ncbi:MAG: energy transducer TonB [Blastocatellia bacterium]